MQIVFDAGPGGDMLHPDGLAAIAAAESVARRRHPSASPTASSPRATTEL